MGIFGSDATPISLRRADFLVVLWAALGVFWIVGAFGDGVPAELLSFDTFFVANGFFWLGGAVFYHRRPDSVRRGDEPTPSWWFWLGGVVVGVLALFLVLVILL